MSLLAHVLRPAVAAVALLALPATARAQPAPSPYVPLGDAAYAYVDALQARGALDALSLLERPYTVRAVRDAAGAVDTIALGGVPRRWLRELAARLDRLDVPRSADPAAPRAALWATAGAWGETSAQRDLLRADDVSGARPFAGARLALAAGPVVAVGHALLDQRLREDPEFTGSRLRSTTARTEEGYVAAQWRYGSAFLGRQRRSWGPASHDGLLVGGWAYSYDHAAATLGDERLRLSSIVARLDPYVAGADSGTYQRFFAAHRLAGRWRGLEAGISETVVFGGVGRGFDWAYLNPLNIFQLAQFNEAGGSGNTAVGADVAWRTRGRGVYAAQLLVDDLQLDDCADVGCREPASLGLTLSAEGVPTGTSQRLFASWTRVSNLAYRTIQSWENYAVNGASLGRNATDYDELRAGVDLALPVPGAWRAYAAYRRQGEGDWRQPYPAREDFPVTPEILSGVVERTARVAVRGSAAVGPLELDADVGYNRVRDAGHVAGRARNGVEARVRVAALLGPVGLLR